MNAYHRNIHPWVEAELLHATRADIAGQPNDAFTHLERAHVLGQPSTVLHVRVHWHMFLWGWRHKQPRECCGQLLRIVGAATKTAIGWVPSGNTGGAKVSPFRPMPIAPDLAAMIQASTRPKHDHP
jgi:hypothetical protein